MNSQGRNMRTSRHLRFGVLIGAASTAIALVGATPAMAFSSGVTTRVSVAADGTEGDGPSYIDAFTEDGRYVVYDSESTNLNPDDTDDYTDVYVLDRTTGVNELATVDSDEVKAPTGGYFGEITPDGRYVAFSTNAGLVPADTNQLYDIYVRDRTNGTTTLASVPSAGGIGTGSARFGVISDDGRYVAFEYDGDDMVNGDANGYGDVFVRDMVANTTVIASVSSAEVSANSQSYDPQISGNGRYVIFTSDSTNLVAGDPDNETQVFVRDLQAGTTTLGSATNSGGFGNARAIEGDISSDGRYVVFASPATDLITPATNGSYQVFRRDRTAGTTVLVSSTDAGVQGGDSSQYPRISADGRIVAFGSAAPDLVADDTNGATDIFTKDMTTGIVARMSVNTAGEEANFGTDVDNAISPDGTTVGFHSVSTNLALGTDTPDQCTPDLDVVADPALVDGMPAPRLDTNCNYDVFVHQYLEELPASGADTGPLALIGLVFVGAGLVVLAGRRLLLR